MRKIINLTQYERSLDKLIYIEKYNQAMEVLGDLITFPSFSAFGGYSLVVYKVGFDKYYFNKNYVQCLDLNSGNLPDKDSGLAPDKISICRFDELRQKMRDSKFIISGLNDTVSNVQSVAGFETIQTVSDDYYDRLVALGLTDFDEVDEALEERINRTYYSHLVIAARELLEVIQSGASEEEVLRARRRMSIYALMFMSISDLSKSWIQNQEADLMELSFENLESLL